MCFQRSVRENQATHAKRMRRDSVSLVKLGRERRRLGGKFRENICTDNNELNIFLGFSVELARCPMLLSYTLWRVNTMLKPIKVTTVCYLSNKLLSFTFFCSG